MVARPASEPGEQGQQVRIPKEVHVRAVAVFDLFHLGGDIFIGSVSHGCMDPSMRPWGKPSLNHYKLCKGLYTTDIDWYPVERMPA